MKVGVPTEIKDDEYRVALTPAGARELCEHGHEVLLQAGAGEGSAILDDRYSSQGATILPDAEAVFEQAEMVLGVKEPQPEEVKMLRPEQTLFTFLHLAPDPELTKGLQESGATCVAYEARGGLARPAAAARHDERGRRQDRDPVRGLLPREAPRGPRHPARRGPGGRTGERDGDRRRRRRDERRLYCDRDGGRRLRLRRPRSTSSASWTSPSAAVPRPSTPRPRDRGDAAREPIW